uniref:RRM domain-containing protein n=1 Tax=Kalanchoe fedtschenkoi TaxID=63787 RepID=A0A7N0T5I0_KALFE
MSTSMELTTVKVCNLSLGASEQDLYEFFSFSGEIQYVELKSDNERSQIAYVTFKDHQGADTALLLSGATIVDQSVTISMAPEYQLPPSATSATTDTKIPSSAETVVKKAEDVVSGMLARGFTLGKDALIKAKELDEKHQLTSTATSKVASLDQKIGFTEKLSVGTTIMNDTVREMDEKFQVSEKTRKAFAAAEQTVSSAGSAIMKNRYILTGTSWVAGAFSRVAKAAGEAGQKIKENMAEEEEEGKRLNEMYSPIHHEALPTPSKVIAREQPTSKPAPAQGLIL